MQERYGSLEVKMGAALDMGQMRIDSLISRWSRPHHAWGMLNSSNYDTELSLTGERGITKSATQNPQVRRLIWKSTRVVDKKARPFLWEWIYTVSSGT
jgi:hypothetical protein